MVVVKKPVGRLADISKNSTFGKISTAQNREPLFDGTLFLKHGPAGVWGGSPFVSGASGRGLRRCLED